MNQFPWRVLMAPMCACTDLPFRKMARKFGCEIAYCEMVKDKPVVIGNPRTDQLLATCPGDEPLGIQMAGRDPELMAEAAKKIEDHGAAVVDINLGCPVPKIVKEGCGAALLKEPHHVGTILQAIKARVSIPVTIKMRTGFDEGDTERFLELARTAEKAGAEAITVHGRTRKQRFSGMSNFQAIRKVKAAVSIPVIGNGNIRSGKDAAEMIRETGCDGVMVARGALGNPWIYREIKKYLETGEESPRPTVAERAAVLREHFEEIREFYGEEKTYFRVRRVIHWFVKGAPHSSRLRDRGSRVNSQKEFEELVREFEQTEVMV
jgi:tRNA-dihydrouridine synthase B